MRFAALLCLCLTPFKAQAAPAPYERQSVAAVLVAEAGRDGFAGMDAVAEVILTRTRERHLNPFEVVTQNVRGIHQFSSLNKTTLGSVVRRARASRAWEDALSIANRIYDAPGSFRNVTHGANHFTIKTEKPFWAEGRQPVAIIKHHAFFKL